MRKLPVALATVADDALFERAALAQARVTHNHPQSDAAVLGIGHLLRAVLLGAGTAQLQACADAWVRDEPAFEFRPYPGRASGYVVDTVQSVLHMFFAHDDFEAAVVGTVNRGDDADTTGALVGVLAAARCGAHALPRPWLRKLSPTLVQAVHRPGLRAGVRRAPAADPRAGRLQPFLKHARDWAAAGPLRSTAVGRARLTDLDALAQSGATQTNGGPRVRQEMDDQDEGAKVGLWVVLGIVVLLLFGLIGGLAIRASHARSTARPVPAVIADTLIDTPLSGEIVARVLFESGQAAVQPGSAAALAAAIKAMGDAPGKKLLVAGFHDPSGDATRNAELAKQRAIAVRAALVGQGAQADRVLLRKPEQTALGGPAEEARRVEVRLVD